MVQLYLLKKGSKRAIMRLSGRQTVKGLKKKYPKNFGKTKFVKISNKKAQAKFREERDIKKRKLRSVGTRNARLVRLTGVRRKK